MKTTKLRQSPEIQRDTDMIHEHRERSVLASVQTDYLHGNDLSVNSNDKAPCYSTFTCFVVVVVVTLATKEMQHVIKNQN